MVKQRRMTDYGITIGTMERGVRNKITDVPGVKVGQTTLQNEVGAQTGVTAIIPAPGDIFSEKLTAATHVINGFGKTAGTVQIDELGTLETPILLTNTLNVGVCSDALVKYMLEQNTEIGSTTGTVNPVVGECNDMFVNDIRGLHVSEADVFAALENADVDFAEGAVGAGTGMKSFGLKGGIGSASRLIPYTHGTYTLGVTVLANFGALRHFRLDGEPVGERIHASLSDKPNDVDNGSIMIIVATDLPVTAEQLTRVLKRATIGLGRIGSFLGNGSGDIVIGFTTANRIPHETTGPIPLLAMHENELDPAFVAIAEATEEAVLNAMITADTMRQRNGKTLYSLRDFAHLWEKEIDE